MRFQINIYIRKINNASHKRYHTRTKGDSYIREKRAAKSAPLRAVQPGHTFT